MAIEQPSGLSGKRKTLVLTKSSAGVPAVPAVDGGQREGSADQPGALALVQIEDSPKARVEADWDAISALADNLDRFNNPVTLVRGPNPPGAWYEGAYGTAPVMDADEVSITTSDGHIHRLPHE